MSSTKINKGKTVIILQC